MYERRKVDIDLIVTLAFDDEPPSDTANIFEEALMKIETKINEMDVVSVSGGRAIVRAHIKGAGEEVPI